MSLTNLIYVLIYFNQWLITIHKEELSQPFSLPPLNLHINQILVDNSNGEMDLAMLRGITLSHCASSYAHIHTRRPHPPNSPRPELTLSLPAKLLVECIKSRDAERARQAIWWKQKLHVHFYDAFMLSRLFLMWPVRASWDLQRARSHALSSSVSLSLCLRVCVCVSLWGFIDCACVRTVWCSGIHLQFTCALMLHAFNESLI